MGGTTASRRMRTVAELLGILAPVVGSDGVPNVGVLAAISTYLLPRPVILDVSAVLGARDDSSVGNGEH